MGEELQVGGLSPDELELMVKGPEGNADVLSAGEDLLPDEMDDL